MKLKIRCYHPMLNFPCYHVLHGYIFLFQKISLLQKFLCWCYGVCFLFQVPMWPVYSNRNLTVWICATTHFWNISIAGICTSQCWFLAHTRANASSHIPVCFEQGVSHTIQTAVPQNCMQYDSLYSFL